MIVFVKTGLSKGRFHCFSSVGVDICKTLLIEHLSLVVDGFATSGLVLLSLKIYICILKGTAEITIIRI